MATRHTKRPIKRPTIQVETHWLEPEAQEALETIRRVGPPPIPGAETHAPPMPVHPSLSPKAFSTPVTREEDEKLPRQKSSRPSRAPRKR